MIPRRTLLRSLGALLVAPAIVRVGSIMPVRAVTTVPVALGPERLVGWVLLDDAWGRVNEGEATAVLRFMPREGGGRLVDLVTLPSPPSVV